MLRNILFLSKSLNNLSPSLFNTWSSFSLGQDNYEMSISTHGNLIELSYKTNKYGKDTITLSALELCSKMQKQLKYALLKDVSSNRIQAAVPS